MSTSSAAVWEKEPDLVSNSEYKDLYRSLTTQNDEYFAKQHFVIEGQLEFNAILFIPNISTTFSFDKSKFASQQAKDLTNAFIKQNQHSLNLTIPPLIFHIVLAYYFDNNETKGLIKLYARNILLEHNSDEFIKHLLPEYLNFIYGVVNSQDIDTSTWCSNYPITESRIIKLIRKNNVKKIISLLTEMSDNDKNRYSLFYKHYAKQIKFGICHDSRNRKKLANLLRFYSNKTGYDEQKCQMISLNEYVDRMKTQRKNKIYYIDISMIKHKKYEKLLQKFDERDLEIIYLRNISIDEYVITMLREYDGLRFMNVVKEDPKNLPLRKKEIIAWNKQKRLFKPLCEKMKDILGDNIRDITVADCSETNACFLLSKSGWSAGMERIMKAQALRDESLINFSNFIVSGKTLEINPCHKIMKYLKTKVDSDTNMDKMSIDIVWLLFEAERVRLGYKLCDEVRFESRVYDLMQFALDME